jgi:ankyrin repeat protein
MNFFGNIINFFKDAVSIFSKDLPNNKFYPDSKLMKVVLENDIDKIKELVKTEDVNYENSYKETATYYASKQNNLEALKVLYQAGANLNKNIYNPLAIAVKNNYVDIVKYLFNICNVKTDYAKKEINEKFSKHLYGEEKFDDVYFIMWENNNTRIQFVDL